MTPKKLRNIKEKIAAYRKKASNLRHRDLERIALALGRKRVKRGKEPTYESTLLETTVVTIPDHGTKTVSPGVAKNVLDVFEEDVFWLEEQLEEQKQREIIHEDRYTH